MFRKKFCRVFDLLLMVLLTSPVVSMVNASEKGKIGTGIADYIIKQWPNPDSITAKQWEYTNGIIFYGMDLIYQESKDQKYYNYIKSWVDKYLNQKGEISPIRTGHNLDVIQPSNLLFGLYQANQNPKYRLGAIQTRKKYENFPVNSEGGFWHKSNYPNQMWLDGQYMAIPFIARYGATFAEPGPDREYCYRTSVTQLQLLAKHALDPEQKLLYHGWNENKTVAWANPATGLSPEFWSRGLGWYCMALVDTLEHLPPDYPGYQDLKVILQTVAVGLKTYQDPGTGLWFQVIAKGNHSGNWLETSGSAMFVYALKKAVAKGYLDGEYDLIAQKGWDGVKSMISFNSKGGLLLRGSVQGMGIQGDYDNYINKSTVDNLPHGMAAAMMAASVMEY